MAQTTIDPWDLIENDKFYDRIDAAICKGVPFPDDDPGTFDLQHEVQKDGTIEFYGIWHYDGRASESVVYDPKTDTIS